MSNWSGPKTFLYRRLGIKPIPLRQASNGPGPLYNPELETYYADYDPDRANKILDEIGLTKRDSEGFRLSADGKKIEVQAFYDTSRGWEDAYETLRYERAPRRYVYAYNWDHDEA